MNHFIKSLSTAAVMLIGAGLLGPPTVVVAQSLGRLDTGAERSGPPRSAPSLTVPRPAPGSQPKVRLGKLPMPSLPTGVSGTWSTETQRIDRRETVIQSKISYREATGNLQIRCRCRVTTETVLVDEFVDGKLVKSYTKQRVYESFDRY